MKVNDPSTYMLLELNLKYLFINYYLNKWGYFIIYYLFKITFNKIWNY